jgi:hypothetical protein
MEPNVVSPIRRWAGALSLPLFFLAMIGASLADPVEDETATPAEQLHQAAAQLGRLQTAFVLELVAAVFFLAATAAIVGRLRDRGAGLANAAGVLALLGGIGLTMIAVAHIYLYALAVSGSADALRILAARDSAAGPLPLLFFAGPFAIAIFCGAAVRGRLVRWPLLVVTAAFLLLEYVPSPLGEVPSLVCGLVAYTWIAIAMIAAPSRTAESRPAAARVPAPAA